MPQVSIIIPLFNRGSLIRATIASALQQSHSDIEVIVVDDGSTDDGPNCVNWIANNDKRVQLKHRNDLPKGAATCRNIGLMHARGSFVLFLDSDDLLAKDTIRNRLAHLLPQNDKDASIGQALIFESQPGDTRTLWNTTSWLPRHDLERFLRQDMPWQTSGPLWRKQSLHRLGNWNQALECFQDWEFHCRSVVQGINYSIIGAPDYFLRRSSDITQISGLHSSEAHIRSRFIAINTLLATLTRKTPSPKPPRHSIKGLIIRNLLDSMETNREIYKELICLNHIHSNINTVDNILLNFISRKKVTWRHSRKQKLLINLFWRDIQYDSHRLNNTFMTSQWNSDVPPIHSQTDF